MIELLERRGGHPGAAALPVRLDAERAPARPRSPAERGLLTLIRAAELPDPEVNAKLGRWEVDFLWRRQALVVEVDGYAAHSSPWAFERDYQKAAELQTAGYGVIRVSWHQIRRDPDAALALIASALATERRQRS